MHRTPYVVVTAIIEREARFLMVEEESEGRLVINQPAGHLEQGETSFEAVKREVLEYKKKSIRKINALSHRQEMLFRCSPFHTTADGQDTGLGRKRAAPGR